MAQPAVQPLGQGLRGFNREPVREVRLTVFAGRLKLLEPPRRLVPNGHDLKADDIHVAGFPRTEIVCDAETLPRLLAWKVECGDLTEGSVTRVGGGVIDHEIVTSRLSGKEPIYRARTEPPFGTRSRFQACERGLEDFAHHLLVVGTRSPAAPLESIQLVQVEDAEHLIERDVVQRARAEKRR